MRKDWNIRKCRLCDVEALYYLIKSVRPLSKFDYDDWVRIYKDEQAQCIWACFEGKKIIGKEHMVPMKLKFFEKELNIAQSMGSMTHPNYQHQGIFTALMKKALDDLRKQNIPLAIGLSNDLSNEVSLKIGWELLGKLAVFIRFINYKEALKIKINNVLLRYIIALILNVFSQVKNILNKNYEVSVKRGVKSVVSFDERLNDFWEKVKNQYPIIIIRDKEYLNARYCYSQNEYSKFIIENGSVVTGYVVIKHTVLKGVKVCFIIDIMAISFDDISLLLDKVIAECYKENDSTIIFQAIANKELYDIYKKHNFTRVPFLHSGYFNIYLIDDSLKIRARDSYNWMVQIGDTDAL